MLIFEREQNIKAFTEIDLKKVLFIMIMNDSFLRDNINVGIRKKRCVHSNSASRCSIHDGLDVVI